mgnify:CR=1 FL=1
MFENGIIKINKNKYIKILKIKPINYNLKTQLEKESILNSYKVFLKACNFDIQILIQSKKEDLGQHINNLKENPENKKKQEYLNQYIKFIQEKNNTNKSVSKNTYLILKMEIKNNSDNYEENIFQELKDRYFKVKDNLSRCGNDVFECSKDECIEILFSFFNIKKYLEK